MTHSPNKPNRINPCGSNKWGRFSLQTDGELSSQSMTNVCVEWWVHSDNYPYLAAIKNPLFLWAYLCTVDLNVLLLQVLVFCRCMFVHIHVCRSWCAQRAEKKKKKKRRAGHKSCARKSNPPTLTNAWWRCHWNLDKVRIGPAVRSSYCAWA